jgi:DNA adenine methylase
MPEFEKLDKDRDVRGMSPEALWYDDAILHYRYHRLKAAGRSYAGWSAEDFVNLHARIVEELRRRGLAHFDRGDALDRDTQPFLKDHGGGPFAEVRPSGNRLGEPIALEDVLPHLRSFKLRQPYAYLVGGLAIHGRTEGDVDILIKDSPALPPEFRHVLEWRILRGLPERLWHRVQFHYDHFHGPFTDNIPLFDLTVERVNPENRVFRMDAEPADLVKAEPVEEILAFLAWADAREKQAPRAGTPEIARQAEASRAEDRVVPFRFFVPMKPVKGAFPEQRQSVQAFLGLFSEEDFPVHSTRKYDGANHEIHKSGERVALLSEDGEDNTARFPGIAAAVRGLPWRDLVVLAEIEMWENGKHLPREAVTGYVHAKGEPDDGALVANVYDVVYAAGGPAGTGLDADAGDIHKLPFARREKYLEALGIAQATFDVPDVARKLNRAPSLVSRNVEELRAHTEALAAKPGSEGNVAKKADGPYSLTGRDPSQIKFHNSGVLAGVVLERIETKTAGTYNYRYAILPGDHEVHAGSAVELGGKTYLEVGKTFSTARKAQPGDVIEVEFETLNLVRHPDGTVSVTAWAPRVMGVLEGRERPDTVDEAVEAAKAGRVFQEKEVTPEGETVYLSGDADDGDPFEKANYVGNKRRLAKYIVGKFPEDGKSVFDPMCGCSAVLIEAARRGYRVRGNDLSIVPYWYSKGVFEGAPLSEEDVEKLAQAPLHEGWLTTGWKGVYPRPRQVRRYLDGLAKRAREWPGPKGWAAKAVASRVLQTLYSDSISGYSTRRYESLAKVRDVARRAAREVSALAAEVAGSGTITNEDAKRMRFPRVDVVYFDPPFFKRDKGFVHYFETYKIMNSILLGREWKESNLSPEDIPPILERLCRSCARIYISTSSNEVVPYARELARLKRTMKRYRVAYTQTSGFGSRDDHQREHLYVAKAGQLAKQADPYMRLPSEERTHRYVVQEHWRGKSVHADFRIESLGNRELIGWTLNVLIAGKIEEPVTTLARAKALKPADYSKIDWETGEFKKRRKAGAEALVDVEVVAERKAVEPHAWLTVEGEVRPGEVGATANFPGVFRIVDKGVCEYGAQKPWFHEYFPRSDRPRGGFRYRVLFRQLRVADIQDADRDKALRPELLGRYLERDADVAREDWDAAYWEFLKAEAVIPAAETKFRDEAAWLLIKPVDQTPYVLSDRAVEDGWVPPAGFSGLPRAAREKVPPAWRYWQMERESERRRMRDALVAALADGALSLPGVEKAAGEFEKRKLVPFNQWGGSAKYAASLAKRLPEHRRYVEPFCGSAALFFAKEPAAESVLADADPEVVFALRYIQRLTPRRLEALKRFPWTVSRAGYRRAKECKPASDAERFWRLAYGRLCAWGGRPQMSGFSTIHEGQTYDLEELWRFHEKLKGARIVRKDWRETVRETDGAGALFFLDPPYVDEWGTDEGIAPEEIAAVAGRLKGEFLIAYTDSARARRAFARVGRLFKMKFLEARNRGLWAKRNRLFVASFGIKKSDDLEWIDLPAAPLCNAAQAGAAEGAARFVLQYHYFRKRGAKPVRAGPTTWHYDLRIDAGEKTLRHWVLDHDITRAAETVGYFKRDADKRALEAEGFYPPGSFMNPTKDTPSFVEVVDKGACRLLVDEPGLVKVAFEGEKLQGAWLLEKKNSNWHVRRVREAPAAEKREVLACFR